MSVPLLNVSDLQAWYGESHVLHGLNLHVNEGEMICILGRNGMGKTTSLRAIMGILRKRTGQIEFGVDIMALPLHKTARAGLGFVPEERGILATLSVEENLDAAAQGRRGRHVGRGNLRAVPEPCRTPQQPGHQAVGGEQQMLAIARASCAPARAACFWTNRPKGWRR